MSALIKYDQARQALAACRNVDDIKDIRDKSEAMRLYAKQANDTELEQWAAEIKFRAQRAIGELSAALPTQNGGFGMLPTGGKHKAEMLADAGISTSAANRYEKLAAIPEPEIEAFIAKSKEVGKPVSVKSVMATLAPKPTPAAPEPAFSTPPTTPVLNEDTPDFSRLGIDTTPRSEAEQLAHDLAQLEEGDVPDLEATNTLLEREIEGLQEQIVELKKTVAHLGGTDQTARIEELALDRDSMHSLAITRFNDLAKANNTIIKYKSLLDKMRKAARVEKYSDILSCITPISQEG